MFLREFIRKFFKKQSLKLLFLAFNLVIFFQNAIESSAPDILKERLGSEFYNTYNGMKKQYNTLNSFYNSLNKPFDTNKLYENGDWATKIESLNLKLKSEFEKLGIPTTFTSSSESVKSTLSIPVGTNVDKTTNLGKVLNFAVNKKIRR